jgi:hypothetical protein
MGAIKRPISRARRRNTKSRQKQWSDLNYYFPELQLSHINKGSAVLTLVMCSLRSSMKLRKFSSDDATQHHTDVQGA